MKAPDHTLLAITTAGLFIVFNVVFFGTFFVLEKITGDNHWMNVPITIGSIVFLLIVLLGMVASSFGFLEEYKTWKERKEREKRRQEERQEELERRNRGI